MFLLDGLILHSMAFEANKDVSLNPVYTELLTPEHFLEMYARERDNIQSARPVASPLGSRTLGRILVQRKRPFYAAAFNARLPK
jgi:hypothetical protein